ncbi:Ankyrin repeat and SOCS box protein 3 [Rhizophlyctis rosea]|nr:Ankyrin repeat and SOCS box protein 3 [Rhizophlyctis rosea]
MEALQQRHLEVLRSLLPWAVVHRRYLVAIVVTESARTGEVALFNLARDAITELEIPHEAMRLAVAGGWAELVRLLLEAGGDPNAAVNTPPYPDDYYTDGFSLVGLAAGKGHLDIIQVLIEFGADVYARTGEPLSLAAENGQLEIIRFLWPLMKDSANYKASTLHGALWEASSSGHLPLVLYLLEEGADVHFEDDDCLRAAAEDGHAEVAKVLLDAGAVVKANEEDESALSEAAKIGRDDIVRLLLGAGADVNVGEGNALYQAAAYGELEVVCTLLENGAEVDIGERTALVVAVEEGCAEVIRKLLKAGANPNFENGSILSAAVERGDEEIIGMLLEAGADVNIDGGNVLLRAVEYGRQELVRTLLMAGADVHVDGGIALVRAVEYGRQKLLQMLLEAGADVNASDGGAITMAARRGDAEMVDILLAAGADVTGKGEDALSAATKRGCLSVVNVLLDAGAKVNEKIDDALYSAAVNSFWEIVKTLVWAGANPAAHNGDIMVLAAQRQQWDVVQQLLDAGADAKEGVMRAAVLSSNLEMIRMLAKSLVDRLEDGGATLLSHAGMWGRLEAMKILSRAGASFDQVDPGTRENLLFEVAVQGRVDELRYIASLGVDVNGAVQRALAHSIREDRRDRVESLLGVLPKDKCDVSWWKLVSKGYSDMVETILGGGVEAAVRDQHFWRGALGGVPMTLALEFGNIDQVEEFMDISFLEDWLALEFAIKYNSIRVIETLLRIGVQADAETVIKAMLSDRMEAIETLLNAGVDIHAETRLGYVFVLAIKERETRLVQMLLNRGVNNDGRYDGELAKLHGTNKRVDEILRSIPTLKMRFLLPLDADRSLFWKKDFELPEELRSLARCEMSEEKVGGHGNWNLVISRV